jgi:hypothetical protein
MSALEKALQWIADKVLVDPELAYTAAKAAAMVEVYAGKSAEMILNIVSMETFYELPVINPGSARQRKAGYTHAGYLDGIVRGSFAGREGTFVLERKTCDQDITETSSYWNRLLLNHQLDEYALAHWQQHGQLVDGVIYDVLRQPGISPREMTLTELGTLAKEGTYCGRAAYNAARMMALRFVENRERFMAEKKNHALDKKKNPELGEFLGVAPEQPRETPHLFRLRCLSVLEAKPESYFAQKFVPKTEPELLEYAHELWAMSGLIHECQSKEDSPRNPDACFHFNSTCEYIGLCTSTESEDATKWDRKPIVNPTRLSRARISCFQQCRRKHFFRYVAGIVPVERPATEKQELGSLVHEALEILWRQ